jgi:hypothetical protein
MHARAGPDDDVGPADLSAGRRQRQPAHRPECPAVSRSLHRGNDGDRPCWCRNTCAPARRRLAQQPGFGELVQRIVWTATSIATRSFWHALAERGCAFRHSISLVTAIYRERKSGSQLTHRWREKDSNPRSPHRGQPFFATAPEPGRAAPMVASSTLGPTPPKWTARSLGDRRALPRSCCTRCQCRGP